MKHCLIKNHTMKHWGIALCAATLLFCACEKIYTPEELGMIVEWRSSGWSEVINETGETATLVTLYPSHGNAYSELTTVILPGDAARFERGAFLPLVSIEECASATIRLSNETEIVCTRGTDDPWSDHFYNNRQSRDTFEIVVMPDIPERPETKVRHNLVISTYHIDQTLVDLWKQGLKNQ